MLSSRNKLVKRLITKQDETGFNQIINTLTFLNAHGKWSECTLRLTKNKKSTVFAHSVKLRYFNLTYGLYQASVMGRCNLHFSCSRKHFVHTFYNIPIYKLLNVLEGQYFDNTLKIVIAEYSE